MTNKENKNLGNIFDEENEIRKKLLEHREVFENFYGCKIRQINDFHATIATISNKTVLNAVMNQLFEVNPKSKEGYEKFTKQAFVLSNTVVEVASAVAKSIKPFAEAIQGFQTWYSKWAEQMAPLAKSITAISEVLSKEMFPIIKMFKEQAVHQDLFSYTWFVCDLFPEQMEAIKEILEKEDLQESEVEEYFCDFYLSKQQKNLDIVVENLCNLPIIQKRKKLIEEAYAVVKHCLKNKADPFVTSIPFFQTQLDGVLTDFYMLFYPDTNIAYMRFKDKALMLMAASFQLKEHTIAKGINAVCFGQFFQDKEIALLPLNDIKLNRHAILHGSELNYATRANLVRIILFLYFVSSIASKDLGNGVGNQIKEEYLEYKKFLEEEKKKLKEKHKETQTDLKVEAEGVVKWQTKTLLTNSKEETLTEEGALK